MKLDKSRRLAIAGIAGVALAVGGAASITAAGSQESAYAAHFWNCVSSMITAPDQHAAECLSGRIGPGLTSLSTPVTTGGSITPPTSPEPTGPQPTQAPT